MLCRVLAVIAVVAGSPLDVAGAQFGDMPGPSDETSMPPAQCKDLLALREELETRGAAITAATKSWSNFKAACQVFSIYVATEAKLLAALDSHGARCGVP